MITPASSQPQSLTITQVKPGLRVMLTDLTDQTDDVRAYRGKVVQVRAGWIEVRFDDGVTRMCRAKTLAPDDARVIEFKVQTPVAAPVSKTGKPAAADLGRQLAAGRKAGKDALGLVANAPIGRAPKAPRQAPKSKPESKTGPCLCFCGATTKPGRSFLPGHDARFHGWMRRLADGRLAPAEVPAAALRLMNLNGDNVPTTDYDGSPWKP